MNTWLIILIVFAVILVFYLLTRPQYVPVAWYDVMPTVYDRLPTMMRYESGYWSGRGIHRGGHDLGSGAFRGAVVPH